MTALSVWISASVSPSLTRSPALTSHLTNCPLSIVGLSLAIFTSIGTARVSGTARGRRLGQSLPADGRRPRSAIEDVVHLGDDPVDARQHRGFEVPVVRDRGIAGGHAADGRVELVEDLLRDPVGNAGAEATVRPVFLDDHGAVRPGDGTHQGVEVEG